MHSSSELRIWFGEIADADSDIANELRTALASAQAAWPGISLSAREFVRHLAKRMPAGAGSVEALRTLHVSDLYLACACAGRDETAVEEFETKFLSRVPSYLSKLDVRSEFVDEVRQQLRVRLLIGAEGKPPGMLDYAGRGPLAKWLRVTALRSAFSLLRLAEPSRRVGDDDLIVAGNPELAYLREASRREFEEALRVSLGSLDAEERTLLRLHFSKGLSSSQIAPMFRTHRTTIRRRLNEIQARLLKLVHKHLKERMRLSESEVESLLRVGRNELQVSLSALFDAASR